MQFRRKGHAEAGPRESYDFIGLFFTEIVRWEQQPPAVPFFFLRDTT